MNSPAAVNHLALLKMVQDDLQFHIQDAQATQAWYYD